MSWIAVLRIMQVGRTSRDYPALSLSQRRPSYSRLFGTRSNEVWSIFKDEDPTVSLALHHRVWPLSLKRRTKKLVSDCNFSYLHLCLLLPIIPLATPKMNWAVYSSITKFQTAEESPPCPQAPVSHPLLLHHLPQLLSSVVPSCWTSSGTSAFLLLRRPKLDITPGVDSQVLNREALLPWNCLLCSHWYVLLSFTQTKTEHLLLSYNTHGFAVIQLSGIPLLLLIWIQYPKFKF